MASNPIPFPYPEEIPFEGLEEVIAYEAMNPEELVIAADTQDKMILTMRKHLSPRQALVIEAHYLDGESLEDIAIRTGMTLAQVGNARRNALATLRKVKGLQKLFGVL